MGTNRSTGTPGDTLWGSSPPCVGGSHTDTPSSRRSSPGLPRGSQDQNKMYDSRKVECPCREEFLVGYGWKGGDYYSSVMFVLSRL